jgi:hypothetical protein
MRDEIIWLALYFVLENTFRHWVLADAESDRQQQPLLVIGVLTRYGVDATRTRLKDDNNPRAVIRRLPCIIGDTVRHFASSWFSRLLLSLNRPALRPISALLALQPQKQ